MYSTTFEIKFSKKLTKEIEDKAKAIINALKEKLEKQGTKLNYKIKTSNDEMILEADSNSLTATDFIVQIDKQLREIIGREFKMGLKEFKIAKYEIIDELEEVPKKTLTLPLVQKLTIKDKKIILLYENIQLDWIKNHYVEKTLKVAKDKIKMMNYEGKDEFREYVWEGKQRKLTYNGDPAVDLENKNWIRRTEAKGQYVYGREFTALLNVMKELYIEHIYSKNLFFEMTFPKFEPWAVPMKSGHAKNIYPNAYFVSVPKNSSPEYWQEVMDLFTITGEIQIDKIKEKTDCVGIMSYAQCPPFWPYLQNKIIDEQTLPLKVYD